MSVIAEERANTKSYQRAILIGSEQTICLFKIQAVTEQQRLGFRINVQLLIMGDHAIRPLIGVAAVMTHAAEQSTEGQIKVLQKTICGNRIR